MNHFEHDLQLLKEPSNYFEGRSRSTELPLPRNILLFLRDSKSTLQQEAIQNRSHHRHVLAFNLRTEGRVHIDHLSLALAPGQAALIFPYQFHHYSGLASETLQWLFCTFEIASSDFLGPLKDTVVTLGERSRGMLQRLLRAWHESSEEPGGEILQPMLLELLLQLKMDREAMNPEPQAPAGNSLVRSVNEILAQHPGRFLQVGELAQLLGVSESQLHSHFRKAAGIPLGGYLQNHRMNRAMSLLKNTDLRLYDVAERCGFGSPQAFNRTFKAETGVTPLKYRRQSLPLPFSN